MKIEIGTDKMSSRERFLEAISRTRSTTPSQWISTALSRVGTRAPGGLLMHELGHRMKNTISVVQTIATHSLRNATSLDDASEKIQSRVAAYSTAHEILLQKDWVGATLGNVVEAATINIGLDGSDRIRMQGPDVELGPQAALSFSLVL